MSKLYYRIKRENTQNELDTAEFLYKYIPEDRKCVLEKTLAKQRGEYPYSEEEYLSLKALSSNGAIGEYLEWTEMWDFSRS